MLENASERLVGMLGRVTPPDIVRMQRQEYDAAAFRARAVEWVEALLDHLLEKVGFASRPERAGVVGVAALCEVDEFPAAPQFIGHGWSSTIYDT